MSTLMSSSMMPSSQPDSEIGSPDSFHRFQDDSGVVRSVSAIVTNNSLPRPVSSTHPVTPTRRARPHLDRSASSPHVSLTPGGRSSIRNSPFPSLAKHREWTLFGQLMEDEGQIRPITGSKIRRRNGHGSVGTSFLATDQDPFLVSSVRSTRSPLSADPDPVQLDSDLDEYASDNTYDSDDTSLPPPGESESHHRLCCASFQIPTLSRLQKNVLKCGLAYFIASLFTFVPYLSSFLADVTTNGKWERGPSPSGHMVATVYVQGKYLRIDLLIVSHRSVYFNPAVSVQFCCARIYTSDHPD